MKIKNITQSSPEWHAWRSSGLGSSDIAVIMDESPWKNPAQLWHERKNNIGSVMTPWMQKGVDLEPHVRSLLCKKLGYKVEPACADHDDFYYFKASFDALDFEAGAVVEIKVPSRQVIEDAKKCKIPKHYNIQVQWQMFVSGFRQAWYVVYDETVDDIIVNLIQYDEAYVDILAQKAHDFWQSLIDNVPPTTSDGVIEFKEKRAIMKTQEAEVIYRQHVLYKELWERERESLISFSPEKSFKCLNMSATKIPDSEVVSYDIEAMQADGLDIEKYCVRKPKKGTHRITFKD